ncbi:diguanylate cyclase/phosphodiesterase [Roseobacter sp. SK209-2-6]|nr:diguanylate cyclase/phosphodiesterase [Roseobacter sp. SK209-2-6]
MIGGATIWSTHFIAMLAYDPGYAHGYEPLATAGSLAIAIIGTSLANYLLAYKLNGKYDIRSGLVFGLTISAMHYLGMSAYQLPGEIVWETPYLVASILFGAALGAVTYQRIAHAVSRWGRLGNIAIMVSAICSMHFTAMGAINIKLSPYVEVPDKIISDPVLGGLLMAIMMVILIVGFASVSIETSLEIETKNQLEKAALHDHLTGLPNRMCLTQKMSEVASRLTIDERERVAILNIDLDLFKEVNDLYGHAAGDKVLQVITKRLAASLEEDEFLARSGGDEFVAIKRNFRRIGQVMTFAERLHCLISEPVDIGTVSTTIGASIGVATSFEDGRDVRELLHKSEIAMFRAKEDPATHVALFSLEMDQQSRDKIRMIGDLRLACARDEFELVYQLQNDLSSLEPTGFEVLLRWNHPVRGVISPVVFIPLAEETGLIREIGLWVLRTACKEAASWYKPYKIAVNVAPQQLAQASFVEHVSDILMETGLQPERLELEITEASIIDDQAHCLKIMRQLKEMGIRIAMDDFGTGYSSLSTLQVFPFDKIKIDRSFIKDVHKDHQRAAIVRSTLLLGQALDIPVLAEGVEYADELTFLQRENCQSVQGFFFGKPMSLEKAREIVAKPESSTKAG